VRLARRSAAGELAIFLGDRGLHTTIIPETYQLSATVAFGAWLFEHADVGKPTAARIRGCQLPKA
jgi:hypothetical protein